MNRRPQEIIVGDGNKKRVLEILETSGVKGVCEMTGFASYQIVPILVSTEFLDFASRLVSKRDGITKETAMNKIIGMIR